MIRKISNETINAIKDGAVVELGANADIKINGKSVVVTIDGKESIYRKDNYTESKLVEYINMLINHNNHKNLYNIINTLFTEMDVNLTLTFGDYTLGLDKDGDKWYDYMIYLIPTDATYADGSFIWDEALFYRMETYFNTYADLLRGETDIIAEMTTVILNHLEEKMYIAPMGGTTVTHKTVVE